jgi:signal transduction histidine kinase
MAQGQQPGPAQGRQRRAHSRRGPGNWPVRTRLFALIAIPTATAVIVSGIRIVSASQSAMAYQRVEVLANLGEAVTTLAQSLEDERDFTAGYIARGKPQADHIVLRQEYSYTDRAARQVTALARGIGAAYPSQTRARAAAVLTRIGGLGNLRAAATGTQLPALVVTEEYAATIGDVLAMDDEIAQGGGDAALEDTVRVLGLLSRMKEEASQQRAILDVAFTMGRFMPGALGELTAAAAEEQSNLAVFNTSATVAQRQEYLGTVSGPLTSRAQSQEQSAVSLVSGGGSLATDPTTADDWYGAMSDMINRMRTVEKDLAGSIAVRARALLRGAMMWAVMVSIAMLLVLALSLILTTFIARSMVRPLARLRAGALEVAGVRLPEMVRRLSESGGEQVPPDVEPIDVDTTDEIGEVARAFDQVHREALRLAANEAMLRGNVNAMFVNLSRRSQSLVERQIQLIDGLERDEEDSGRLSSLFQMDHLATRMRRNSENLLVLAGHETVRQWSQPVALIDVLRAALSEIERFDRVVLDVQPGIAVHGHAVNDVVHLVAELAENATSFSPGDSPVQLTGHQLSGGGLLLDITDHGAGMSAGEMAHANWRLDNPPVVDVAASRRMGLYVVARLAARHGIRVRLRSAPDGGLTALVWLPGELVIKGAIEAPPGSRRFAVGAGRTGEKAARSAPQTVAEKVAAAVAAARAPRFAASLEQPAAGEGQAGLGGKAGSAGPAVPAGPAGPAAGPAGPALPAAAPVMSDAVLSAPVREADPDVTAFAAMPPPDPGESAAPDVPPGRTVGGYSAETAYGSAPGPGTGYGSVPGRGTSAVGGFGAGGAFGTGGGPSRVGGSGDPGGDGPSSSGAGAGRGGQVIVPPAAGAGEAGRLPIFEAVESDWFSRSGQPAPAHAGGDQTPLGRREEPAAPVNWTSPADAGWRAAAAAKDPVVGGPTPAGLPKRIPQANLVPGTAAAGLPPLRPQARSADAVKERFASFQRGARAGHAAAHRRRRGPPAGGLPASGSPAGGLSAGGPPAGRGLGDEGESEEDV